MERQIYGAGMHTVGYNTFYTLDEAKEHAQRLHLACRQAMLRHNARRDNRTAGRAPALLVSHGTLLGLRGLTATLNTIPSYRNDALHVTVNNPSDLRKSPGFQFHYSRHCDGISPIDELLSGVSPMQAVCQMGQFTDQLSLIIAMDWMTCGNPELRMCTHQDLRDYLDSCGRFVGSRLCRRALALSREGTDSPQETVLRCACVDFGLPEACVNYEIYDYIGAGRVLKVDLAFPEDRVVIEYDGRYHYTMQRWEADLDKRNVLRALGYQTFVATQSTLASQDNLNTFMRMVSHAIMEHRLHGNFS